MRKRKTKDSKMFLSSKWLTSHSGISLLILITAFVAVVNGSDVAEKPLIIENKLPSSTTLTPVENKTSRSLESSGNHHHATISDKSLDVTTLSSFDSLEEDDDENMSDEKMPEEAVTVVGVKSTSENITTPSTTTTTTTTSPSTSTTTTTTTTTPKPETTKQESTRTSKALKLRSSTVDSTSPSSISTPLRQRSYDISLNKTNDIHPQWSARTEKSVTDGINSLNGADILAYANAESAKNLPSNKTNEPLVNNNNTLKALADWTHIIETMESSTENEMLHEKRTKVPLIGRTDVIPPFSPLPTTLRMTESPVKSTSEVPSTVFDKELFSIGEVYRKTIEKANIAATMKPSERIDVYEYYRTETPLPTTSTEESLVTTTMLMTTSVDKRNTDEIDTTLITTTDLPVTSTTLSRRANYRFTTLSPFSTDFTTTTFEPEKTTMTVEAVTTTTTTTEKPSSSSKFWSPSSTSFSTTPSTTEEMTTTTTTTTTQKSTEIITKIPKTITNFITTQTVVTDNESIWVVTDESSTPMSSESSSFSSTEASTIATTEAPGPDVAAIVVISLSVVGVIAFVLLMVFIFVIRKRQNQTKYANRCRPVGLDAYSLDNVSVYNSVRRKGNNLRLSKRSYGNSAFEDPNLQSHVLSVPDLAAFVQKKYEIYDEYKDIPVITSRIEEMLYGCEDKNRYSNVIPLPETRVHLQRQNDDEKTEYINANYVKGPDDSTNYYIATQAPLDNTIHDFWRMVWEQQSKVIIMATDLSENGVEKCAQYLPSSVVLDNVQNYGNFQVTLKSREVKGEYALSTIHLKHLETKSFREIVHFWYSWPESGVPQDETSLIAMLLEARSYSRLSLPEQRTTDNEIMTNNNNRDVESGIIETNGKMATSTFDSKTRSLQRTQTPIIVHCSPGTSRTGTIIACDIVLRTLEIPPRQIDIPKIVYTVRRGRANAVQTKQQYEFIYKVAHVYATKLNGPSID